MHEKKPWTEHEDRTLKKIVEENKFTKWTQISKILSQEYAIKGRNGKQCKDRYVKHINTLFPQQQWSYQDQLRLIELHNEVGNKWAVIGNRLGGRSDNSVKNNFYSQLRKALKKVADEQLRGSQLSTDLDFANFSNCNLQDQLELKNQLLSISLEEDEKSQIEGSEVELGPEITRQLINKLAQFGVRYKKRGKRNKNVTKGFNLLTPNRYVFRKAVSENQESQSSNVPSSPASNLDEVSQDDISRSSNSRSSRKNSYTSLNEEDRNSKLEEIPTTRARTRSQGNVFRQFCEQEHFYMSQNKQEVQEIVKMENEMQANDIMQGMWQQQNELPLLMVKKSSSRLLNDTLIMRPQFHFFEDSEIQMRILPEVELELSQSQIEQRLFHQ